MMDHLIALICFAACIRLLTYQRRGDRFKRHYSVVAYLAICTTGGLGLGLLTHTVRATELHPLVICLLVAFTFVIFLCRGNIASLLRPAIQLGRYL